MSHQTIQSPQQLDAYCRRLAAAGVIAFDTEFVSETTYRPVLCLIQVATEDEPPAIIDPFKLPSTKPFWDILASGDATVIAHAAREETRFCHRYGGRGIGKLFDTQLAAGFVGLDYPASLASLVQRLVGKSLPKGETRTDWSRRPLNRDQIRYAISDVTELVEMYRQLAEMLDARGRWEWLREETEIRQDKIIQSEMTGNWRKVSGSSGLKPRELEIVRQLWRWREDRARDLDRLPKRVLRDDLIIELAKRGSADVNKVRGIRGMERRHLQDQYQVIADTIARAMETPDDELPRRPRSKRRPVSPMLRQFISTSMACIARQQELSPSIMGNSDDVTEFLAHQMDPQPGDGESALMTGWRGEIVGRTLHRVLAGELAIRIDDLRDAQPLEFVET
ncbi:MAG: HRDC domain-containing protein [Planctomycetota bacterium]